MKITHIKYTVATEEQRQRVQTWLAGRKLLSPPAEKGNDIHVWIGSELSLPKDSILRVDRTLVREYEAQQFAVLTMFPRTEAPLSNNVTIP